ncbi:MAG: tRNA-dihydrouridine synthase family protein [Planctomycetota bacterium]|jgi:nifR3 family TIM-barrel protein|nr:tRNA-dihydrouridine synthase family protein [Planctomycetota bacterium]
MEGITDRSFRKLVVETNPSFIGAVCTEFVRITQPPLSVEKLKLELGEKFEGPVHGIQLMGNNSQMLAESARNAAEAGADFVDLNFGCPAPRVLQHCAGSALLDDPPGMEKIISAVVQSCPVPVTAKIRAGGDDDSNLEDIAQRVEQAGATALCVHGRLRKEKYTDPCAWNRIQRAVEAVTIPVIGNGGVDTHADIERMRSETGCPAVMIGRAALSNPWIFSGENPKRETRIEWLKSYANRMEEGSANPTQALGRLKQAVKYMANARQLVLANGLAFSLRSPTKEALFESLS